MWHVDGYQLSMAKGDWGVQLPLTFHGIGFSINDEIMLKVCDRMSGRCIIEKTFDNIQDGRINIELTEEESGLLSVGMYLYSIDWYQNNVFMCNLIPKSSFKVGDKI